MKTPQLIESVEASEGAGVRIRRAIGIPALRRLDPFLMLDFFGSDNPGDYLAGFPEHPHRGFITITYMLDGRMRHADSMGNEGVIGPGDVQWMKAASGVIHSEMPEQQDGLMRGFQLWLNLPAEEKMSDPAYRDIRADEIPVIRSREGELHLLAGQYSGETGPISDPFTHLFYADVRLRADRTISLPAQQSPVSAFVFVYNGQVVAAGQTISTGELCVLSDLGTLTAGAHGADLIAVAGRPLDEPVVQYGPFVMTNEDEIKRAFADYRAGRLVQKRARSN